MIRFTPEASAEVAEARAWYQVQQRGLGRRFTIAAHETLGGIEELPESYPRVRGEKRRALIRSFPYALYYQINSGDIVIIACVHGSRHPHVWQRRLE
jgi:toxin ParE1/3/4